MAASLGLCSTFELGVEVPLRGSPHGEQYPAPARATIRRATCEYPQGIGDNESGEVERGES
jgi:hypothetical protein